MADEEPTFIDRILEMKLIRDFKVWHILFIILSTVCTVAILLCCCIRFRIPRTKQEIEADYIRRKITRKFQKQLQLIQDTEMDEMNLFKALERIRIEMAVDSRELVENCREPNENAIIVTVKSDESSTLHKRSATAPIDEKSVNVDNASATSEEKLLHKEGNNRRLGTGLSTIVSALNVLRSRKMQTSSPKSRQITV